MENVFKYIACDGLDIAVSITTKIAEEHSAYYPVNILFYVEQGQLNLRTGTDLYTIPANSFGLVRKYTSGTYFKSWGENEDGAITYGFVIQDEFIQSAIKELGFQAPKAPTHERFLLLSKNKILKGLFSSIATYINENESISKELLSLKTKEALMGVLKSNPNNLSIFFQFSTPEKAELAEFMAHNYTLNIPLEQLAKMSGRSLSTFNRAFKVLFNDTPHRWILRKRLQKAKEILLTTKKTSSDIYLELGFEDLAHFSRTFKKEFQMTPTELKKRIP